MSDTVATLIGELHELRTREVNTVIDPKLTDAWDEWNRLERDRALTGRGCGSELERLVEHLREWGFAIVPRLAAE